VATPSPKITPLDVESPKISRDGRLRLFPYVLSNHRSTPSTPAEESRYRKKLLDKGEVIPLEWKGMAFTVLEGDSQMDESDDEPESPTLRVNGSSTSLGNLTLSDTGMLPGTITPPSSPSFHTPALGSPTLSFSGRTGGKDASGTRKMMLKKRNSFIRAMSSASQTEDGMDRFLRNL
jgi:hypothetical protein